MRIEKFVHSCLVFTKEEKRLLVDPGTFSFAEGRVTPEQLTGVDYLVVTHTHPDHMDVDAIRTILAGGETAVFGNDEVAEALGKEGIDVAVIGDGELIGIGPFRLEAAEVEHCPLLADESPKVTAFVLDEQILHCVDSFDDRLNRFHELDLLILPIAAPFLTEKQAYDFALGLKPKAVLPVHDGILRDFFLESRHKNYAAFFEREGIAYHTIDAVGGVLELPGT
jgi:L-ascorbate metabolism protein UlaG (beta-lactamase superfamily)